MRMMINRGILLLFVTMAVWAKLGAQVSKPDTIYAMRISSDIRIDGKLNEPEWQKVQHISNFTQRELNEGEPASEKTEVAVLYNDKYLYIGVWCFDSKPNRIVAREMERDFKHWAEDNFEIVIDTYKDNRTGFLFIINPNGAKSDALVASNGSEINRDWDGVWDVATKVNEAGWFAEIAIPFSTLRFEKKYEQIWGINFERNIRRKREQVLWQGWSRNYDLEQVSHAGTLVGLYGISDSKMFEIKPYANTGFERNLEDSVRSRIFKTGFDVNYRINPNVKINFTINTDFAQVESDINRVNLTRFPLYFPEKREFFLEGENYFTFRMGRDVVPFYSRRIGISSEGVEIPLLGGIKTLAKFNRTSLGIMSMQTAKKDSFPTANYSVIRWKNDVMEESSVGFIGIHKIEPGRVNLCYGTDLVYATTTLLGDKNFRFGGNFVCSYTSDYKNKFGGAYRLRLDYPNDLVEFDAGYEGADKYFNPEVGFLRIQNYHKFFSELVFNPRPKGFPLIRNFVFKPVDVRYSIDRTTGKLITFFSEYRPFGFVTRSGEVFEFNIKRIGDRPEEDFEIHNGITIKEGEYWYTFYELQLRTYGGRRLSAFAYYAWGDFYSGKRRIYRYSASWKISKYLGIFGSLHINRISLPEGTFSVKEFQGRIKFAFSPNLFGYVLGQWNNDDEQLLMNFRLNWIPKPGTDVFFVVNQVIDTSSQEGRIVDTVYVLKFVWRMEV